MTAKEGGVSRSDKEHLHLLGIGGTGMTALAGLLHESGCRVSGTDQALYPPTSTILERMGLQVYEGYDPAHLEPAPDAVVVGNAISRGNAELEHVLDARLPYTSMPALIGQRFLTGRHAVVVSGTHGKTTTCSMLAWVLARAGHDPGFLIGGSPLNFELPFRLGTGEAFVIEGDEYDSAFFDKGPKFMHYRPAVVLLGAIEFDHADIYRDLDAVKTAFARLVNLVPRSGLLLCHEDNAVARELAARAWSRVEGYGFEHGLWRAGDLEEHERGTRFTLRRDGRPFLACRLGVTGAHNVLNATAVAACASDYGLRPEEIRDGLESFRGVRRRLELQGEVGGVTVLDDFAHHPTAIANTLGAVRRRYGSRRVWAVLEPRSWSMRKNVFQDRLVDSFDAADRVLIAPVYAAQAVHDSDRLDPDRLALEINERGPAAEALGDTEAVLDRLLQSARPGDVVVAMSNGGFGGLLDRLLRGLLARQA